jgi:hypothetical protein
VDVLEQVRNAVDQRPFLAGAGLRIARQERCAAIGVIQQFLD